MRLLASIGIKGGTAALHILKLLKNLFDRNKAIKLLADYLAKLDAGEAIFKRFNVD